MTFLVPTLAGGVVVVEGGVVGGVVTTVVMIICAVDLAVLPSLSVTVAVLLSVAAAEADTLSFTVPLVPDATVPRSQTTSAGVPLLVHVPVAGVVLVRRRDVHGFNLWILHERLVARVPIRDAGTIGEPIGRIHLA